ncbi:MAG: transposase [bacterium]
MVIKRDSTQEKGSDDDGTKGFISAFRERIAVIIEHYEVYRDFFDKLPTPFRLSEEFLREFIDNLGQNEIPERSLLAQALKSGARRYVRKRLHQTITMDCHTLYQNVLDTQGPHGILADEAEKRLRSYEINVLNITNRLFERDREFCDHTRIAKKAIDQLINQVIRNGTHDNKGDPIENYYAYILKIISSRINNEKARNRPVCIFSSDIFDFFESPYGRDVIERIIHNKQVGAYLRNRFYPHISTLDGFIFRAYFLEEFNQAAIQREVHEQFGKDMSIASISRRLQRLLEIIKQDLARAPFDIDAIIGMMKQLNSSPLESDWLFLFLDLNHLKGLHQHNKHNRKRRSMHLIAYGLTASAGKRIVVEKTYREYNGLTLWLDELRAMKERGMMRVLMVTTEDYPELEHCIEHFFPKVDYQFSLNGLRQKARKFLSDADQHLFCVGLEEILACTTCNEGHEQLCALCHELRGRYDGEGRRFIDTIVEKADHILPCLQYPPEIRKIISNCMACTVPHHGKRIDSQKERSHCQEKELMVRTKTWADELLKKNLVRYDDTFKKVLPQLTVMFNQRF